MWCKNIWQTLTPRCKTSMCAKFQEENVWRGIKVRKKWNTKHKGVAVQSRWTFVTLPCGWRGGHTVGLVPCWWEVHLIQVNVPIKVRYNYEKVPGVTTCLICIGMSKLFPREGETERFWAYLRRAHRAWRKRLGGKSLASQGMPTAGKSCSHTLEVFGHGHALGLEAKHSAPIASPCHAIVMGGKGILGK